MRKPQFLILLAFIALFGAGVVSALVADRYLVRRDLPRSPNPTGGGMIAQELGLSKEQHEQLAKIWSDVREESRKNWDSRRASQQQRDKDIEAMLTPEQRKQLEAITAAHEARQQKIRDLNDELTKSAEQKTRDILTDSQKQKFEAFLRRNKERGGERGERGDRPPGPRGGPMGGPMGAPMGAPTGAPMGAPMGGPSSRPFSANPRP